MLAFTNVTACRSENSSVNVLMHFFNRRKKKWSLSLISPPLLYPSIQMGTAWDERISLYWTWLNAVLMKAHADNSFFIMSLAGLGISFSVAEREREVLILSGWVPASLTGVRLCVWEYYFFVLHFCSIKLHGETEQRRVWGIVFTPKNRRLRLRKINPEQLNFSLITLVAFPIFMQLIQP